MNFYDLQECLKSGDIILLEIKVFADTGSATAGLFSL